MKLNIKLVKPEEISLETLLEIQKKVFDDVYIKQSGESLKEDFNGSSYAIALDGTNIAAYYQYFAPEDACFKSYAEQINYLLAWREKILLGNCDLTELVERCKISSGLPVSLDNHDIVAFPCDINFNESKDIFSAELAVLPEYRRKGIATSLIKRVKDETKGYLFALNRKNSIMYSINKKRGAQFLMQIGPIFEDGSSLVLSVK